MDDAQLVDALTRHLQAAGPDAELGAPYDDLVAGLVSGTLLDDERERALELLGEHPELRTLLGEVDAAVAEDAATDIASPADDTAADAHVHTRRGRRFPAIAAVAAAALLAVGLWALLGDRTSDDPSAYARLEASARALATETPDVFEGFTPLSEEALRERPSETQRGGLTLLAPRGAILDGTPTMHWQGGPEGVRYRVTVRDDEGALALDTTTDASPLAWPEGVAPLTGGARYVVRVQAVDTATLLYGARSFATLDVETKARYERGLSLIDARGGPDAEVLAAHWAISFELFAQAGERLDRIADEGDADESLAATRAWLDAVRGTASR